MASAEPMGQTEYRREGRQPVKNFVSCVRLTLATPTQPVFYD